MSKLLRAFIILFLALSVGALALGIMLFTRREVLKGRNIKLESTVAALGTVVEAGATVLKEKPEYPSRDMSPCTSDPIENPELSPFWESYSPELEFSVESTVSVDRDKLASYYKVDPITGKTMRHVTQGEGTMQAVLDDLLAKAGEQYNRLNLTRQQLKDLRVEHVDTVQDLNNRKGDLRSALKEVKDLKSIVEPLKQEITNLNVRVEELNEDKLALNDQISEQKRQMAIAAEENAELDAAIERLKKEIEGLRGSAEAAAGSGPALVTAGLQPGVKGTVAAVNDRWNFVVLDLTDSFLHEILGDDLSGPLPSIELMVKRAATPGKFVTRVKLLGIRKDYRLAIADILTNWQQLPVKEGDVVFN